MGGGDGCATGVAKVSVFVASIPPSDPGQPCRAKSEHGTWVGRLGRGRGIQEPPSTSFAWHAKENAWKGGLRGGLSVPCRPHPLPVPTGGLYQSKENLVNNFRDFSSSLGEFLGCLVSKEKEFFHHLMLNFRVQIPIFSGKICAPLQFYHFVIKIGGKCFPFFWENLCSFATSQSGSSN